MKWNSISHCDGQRLVPETLQREIGRAIDSLTIKRSRGAVKDIRDQLTQSLHSSGWASETQITRESDMTITSVKSDVGLCLQTGNMARMYADLLKLQKLYLDGAIKSGVMIVPSQPCAQALGDNLVNSARLERELVIFRKVIHLPLVIYSLE